jgi:protein phosphatase
MLWPSKFKQSFSFRVDYDGATDVGPQRTHNEDTFGFFSPDARSPEPRGTLTTSSLMAVVSDGVGGQDAGEVASAIAVAALGCAMPLLPFSEQAIRDLLQRINTHIFSTAARHAQQKRMAATLAALWIHDGQVAIIHCGDSRVYRINGSTMEQMTVDHTEADTARASGILSSDAARKHPRRHILQQALGIAPKQFAATIQFFPVQPQTSYLLCTDGVSDALTDATIINTFQASLTKEDGHGLAQQLIQSANTDYGRDNVTAAIVHIRRINHKQPRTTSIFSAWLKGR